MPVIDVHTHMFTAKWLELLKREGGIYNIKTRPDGQQEIFRGDMIGRRLRAIVVFADDQKSLSTEFGADHITGAAFLPMLRIECLLDPACPIQPSGIAIGRVHLDETGDEERVVRGKARGIAPLSAIAAP